MEAFFNLKEDIGEKHDLSAQRWRELAMVKARWEAWQKEMDGSEPRGPFRDYLSTGYIMCFGLPDLYDASTARLP